MGKEIAYTPGQVQIALRALARDHGDVDKTAERLLDDGEGFESFMVPAGTLDLWKNETHAEQYKQLVERMGAELERDAVIHLQRTITRANRARDDLIERVSQIERPELVSQALRAISDASAKSTNQLMQLTGRPVAGAAGDASVEAITRVVKGLEAAGLISVSPRVSATLTPEDVEEVKD